MFQKVFLYSGILAMGCASDIAKGFSSADVRAYCETQEVWVEGCSLDANSFSNASCEEGIISIVDGCDELTLSLYGEAYSSFYSCLQEKEYCPEQEESREGFDQCTTIFRESVDLLELECTQTFDENSTGEEAYLVEPEVIAYESPPLEGESLALLDDQRVLIELEESFGDHSSFWISSNGLVQLGGEEVEDCCFGQELISSSTEEVIAVTWADLNPELSGDIRWKMYEDTDRGKALVVIYEAVALCCEEGDAVTSWARIWEDDHSIEIHIGAAQSEYPVTIGVQYLNGVSVLPEHHAQGVTIEQEAWLYTPQLWEE